MSKITMEQLKELIKECACQAMKDRQKPTIELMSTVIPDEPAMHSELFPGLGKSNKSEFSDEFGFSAGHSDEQGEKPMILGNLEKMADRATELKAMASQIPDNEEWVQEKIAVASAMIDSIYNFMKYSDKE
jgi:hypothetical protein